MLAEKPQSFSALITYVNVLPGEDRTRIDTAALSICRARCTLYQMDTDALMFSKRLRSNCSTAYCVSKKKRNSARQIPYKIFVFIDSHSTYKKGPHGLTLNPIEELVLCSGSVAGLATQEAMPTMWWWRENGQIVVDFLINKQKGSTVTGTMGHMFFYSCRSSAKMQVRSALNMKYLIL